VNQRFFSPNLDRHGRLVRGVIGALCLIAGIIVAGDVEWWIGLILVAAGLFAIFEAVARWCLLRACGIKTKL
jgi:membrane-bound ClpP family serine protease